MSITPMEMLSLRPGTRMARGDVIIGGLGLGHQLIEVSKRPQVRRLVLVEKSQGLVDFMMPAIAPHLHRPVDVVVGDAYEVIPQMYADVALIDIYPKYGRNRYLCNKLKAASPGIKKFWCWGALA
jgi:spermidine synthase